MSLKGNEYQKRKTNPKREENKGRTLIPKHFEGFLDHAVVNVDKRGRVVADDEIREIRYRGREYEMPFANNIKPNSVNEHDGAGSYTTEGGPKFAGVFIV